jgi:hypothetical protein
MYLSPDFTTVPEKLWPSEALAAPLAEAPAAALGAVADGVLFAGALSFELGVCAASGVWVDGVCVDGVEGVCVEEEGGCCEAGGTSGVGAG